MCVCPRSACRRRCHLSARKAFGSRPRHIGTSRGERTGRNVTSLSGITNERQRKKPVKLLCEVHGNFPRGGPDLDQSRWLTKSIRSESGHIFTKLQTSTSCMMLKLPNEYFLSHDDIRNHRNAKYPDGFLTEDIVDIDIVLSAPWTLCLSYCFQSVFQESIELLLV